MINFAVKDSRLILIYNTEQPWISNKFDNGHGVTIKKVFNFSKEDLYSPVENEDGESVEFVLGILIGEYFKIDGRIFEIPQSIFIHKGIKISEKFFIAIKGISIFKKIGEVVKGDIYIGGDAPEALPKDEFTQIIKDFPNSYEIKKYAEARLSVVLKNYFDSASNIEEKYSRYMDKRKSMQGDNAPEIFKGVELQKYEFLLQKLESMLSNEISYTERQWQNEIIEIILLLYPKYIRVFKDVPVRDGYAKKDREIDFLLVDSNGNIDIIEIKQPFNNKIITGSMYRDNHIPMRELSGTIMQIEKYILYLNRWGEKGERKLTEKYKLKLPKKFKIKITNPNGIVIMGRDNGLSLSQRGDLEVVKRKYKNIVDIITYDDLLRRLKFIIEALR